MAKVVGVGGIFFKAKSPSRLAKWYSRHLGMKLASKALVIFKPTGMPSGGATVWSPFPASTRYFAPSARQYMINLVVDDLDGALRQVVRGGAKVVGEVQDSPYGRFGWFLDPERNKVELWEPPQTKARRRPGRSK